MTTRAVLYARVSGDDRSKEGRNLAGQLDMCREYAQKRGNIIVDELAEDDRGASGAQIDLPQLTRARDMAASGVFDVLIVREIDRLSRSLAKQLIVEQELRRAGVGIEYVLGEYPDTPEGNFQKHIKATVAEYEREKITERSVRGRRNKAKAGHVMAHGRSPYGYRLAEVNGKRTLAIHEPEARIVRLIFQWYVAGDARGGQLSLRAITQRLTEMGVPTKADTDPGMAKQRGRGEWNRTTVRKMVKCETYAGVFHYGKRYQDGSAKVENPRETWIPVEVPAIVSRDVWEAAQHQLVENVQNAVRNTKREYLLRRRVSCASCGVKMYARSVNQGATRYRSYYACGASRQRFDYARACTQTTYFRADHVDAVVWEWMKSFLTDRSTLEEGLAEEQEQREQNSAPLRDRLGVVEDLLTDNQRQLERALDLYLSGDFDKEMLTERKERLQGTIDALQRERTGLTSQLGSQVLTDAQVQTITEFADRVGQGVKVADKDFKTRRRLVELLDVRARLAIEDGEKIIQVQCMLGQDVLSIAGTTSRTPSPAVRPPSTPSIIPSLMSIG